MERKSLTFTKDTFDEQVLGSARPVLVDFWAEWCAPCHRLAAVVERLAAAFEGRVAVGKVNVDDEPELARSHEIRSIPSLLVFREGEVVERIVGVRSFEDLKARLERVLA
jgi:thioredoxin 1